MDEADNEIAGLVALLNEAEDRRLRAEEDFRATSREIGGKARALREAKGISLRRVAAAMKLTPPYISDLERGFRHWSPRILSRYAEAIK